MKNLVDGVAGVTRYRMMVICRLPEGVHTQFSAENLLVLLMWSYYDRVSGSERNDGLGLKSRRRAFLHEKGSSIFVRGRLGSSSYYF